MSYRIYTSDDLWVIFDRKCCLWFIDTKTFSKIGMPLPLWYKIFSTTMPKIETEGASLCMMWLGEKFYLHPFEKKKKDRVYHDYLATAER